MKVDAKELLKKTRKINKWLEKTASKGADFGKLAEILSEVNKANVYISDKDGNILGYSLVKGYDCKEVKKVLKEGRYPEEYNEKLMRIMESVMNLTSKDGKCSYYPEVKCEYPDKYVAFVPVVGGRERLGTLVLARFGEKFNEGDLLLAEYGATIVGIEILRNKNDRMEESMRDKLVVRMALRTLSYSELTAVRHIFEVLEGEEGIVVASKIADSISVTRSVIVNALRKLESAGVIESRSLGMKGTYIKVLSKEFLKEMRG